jgi:hypothetical protein
MGSIHEKNQRPKISCYCTFKCCSTKGSFNQENRLFRRHCSKNEQQVKRASGSYLHANLKYLTILRKNLHFKKLKETMRFPATGFFQEWSSRASYSVTEGFL